MSAPSTPSSNLSGIAMVDTAVTSRVRVRSWHHRFGPTEFPAGAHADIEIAWTIQGEATYRIGEREIAVRAGHGIVVPARVEHATRVTPGLVAGSAWIAPELASEVAASLGRRPSARAELLPDVSDIARIGALLETEAKSARPGQLLFIEAMAEALVVAMLRALPVAGERRASRDPRLELALELLETKYAEPLGVDDLSRAAGISRFHFSRLFREETGMSPYRFLQRVRIARARELLASGHAVTDAALSVGYRDLGRFARAFREQTGMMPSEIATRRERRNAS